MKLYSDNICPGSTRNDLSCDWGLVDDMKTWDTHLPSVFPSFGVRELLTSNREFPFTNMRVKPNILLLEDVRSNKKVDKLRIDIEERIESIIDKAIELNDFKRLLNSTQTKSSIMNLIFNIGIDKFQTISDGMLQDRIEKAIAIELLNNLFSDLTLSEIEEMKRNSRIEGFFR